MPFQIIRDDITHVEADAIVNTANPRPVIGAGTDTAVYQAAGAEKLLETRKKIGVIPRGQAVETPAFGLRARYILHTVGPSWQGGDQNEFEILRSCYQNCLQLAERLGCKSVAFPLISSGSYGFPKDKALQTALSVIQPFVMAHEMTVILVVFSKSAYELSGKVVDQVRSYVDAHYVEQAQKREYPEGKYRRRGRDFEERSCCPPRFESEASEEAICESDFEVPEEPVLMTSAAPKPFMGRVSAKAAAPVPHIDLGGMIIKPDKTFQEKLFEIIDERGLTGPQVYKHYISKQVYSKIQANKDYHPNKYTAIALCLSLHLDIDQTQDLIGRAGWALSPSSKADLVVKACIVNKEYNKVMIDCILFDYDCPALENIK